MWSVGDICWIYREDLDRVVKCKILRPLVYLCEWKLVEVNKLMINWYSRTESEMFKTEKEANNARA